MAKNQPTGTEGVAIDYAGIVTSWSPEERAERERKFLRKIDYRLLPILVLHTLGLFTLSFDTDFVW